MNRKIVHNFHKIAPHNMSTQHTAITNGGTRIHDVAIGATKLQSIRN